MRCGAPADGAGGGADGNRLVGGITFLFQAAAVVGLGGLIATHGWDSLAVPAREITEAVTEALSIDPKLMDPSECATDGSLESNACYARAAGLSLLGVLLVAAALFTFRIPILALFRAIIRLLPKTVGPMLSALLATAVFTMAYATIHPDTELEPDGIVPVERFPPIVGLIAFITATFGSSHWGFSRGVFAIRDGVPLLLRLLLVIAVPVAMSEFLVGNLGDLSLITQEQLVIIVSVVLGSIAFVPSAHMKRSRASIPPRGGRAGVVLAALGAFALIPGVAVADVELDEGAVVPWADASAAGFDKVVDDGSTGGSTNFENPRLAGDGDAITRVTVLYEHHPPDGDPSFKYTVTITAGRCADCNTKGAIEAGLLAADWGATPYHWEGHPDFCTFKGSTFWPCVEEHILPGGVLAAEVFGHSLSDRNFGAAASTYTAVAGDYTLVVDASVIKYGDYTPEFLEDFRTLNRGLVELYAAHLLDISRSGSADAGDTTGGGDSVAVGAKDVATEFAEPVIAIGALAAIAAVAATAGAATVVAGAGAAQTVVPPAPSSQPAFIDPDTGQALPVDGGWVWYGDWMSPADAGQAIQSRIDQIALDQQAATQHQQFVADQQAIRDDQLQQTGHVFDPATNQWKPGEHTNAILDDFWQNKISKDPAWQQAEQQFAAIQYELDMAKTQMLDAHNWHLQKEHDIHMEHDATLAEWEWAAKNVQWVADVSIDVLDTVTAPIPGKTSPVKLVYTFSKTFAGELAEKGISTQSGVTAILKGVTDVGAGEAWNKVSPGGWNDAWDKLPKFGTDKTAKLFQEGFYNATKAQVENQLGVADVGNDAKMGMGALVDQRDADALAQKPAYVETVLKKTFGNMLGGVAK